MGEILLPVVICRMLKQLAGDNIALYSLYLKGIL